MRKGSNSESYGAEKKKKVWIRSDRGTSLTHLTGCLTDVRVAAMSNEHVLCEVIPLQQLGSEGAASPLHKYGCFHTTAVYAVWSCSH